MAKWWWRNQWIEGRSRLAALVVRIGGLGGFGGTVACETVELHYIWHCDITKIYPLFHLRDAWSGGIMVNS